MLTDSNYLDYLSADSWGSKQNNGRGSQPILFTPIVSLLICWTDSSWAMWWCIPDYFWKKKKKKGKNVEAYEVTNNWQKSSSEASTVKVYIHNQWDSMSHGVIEGHFSCSNWTNDIIDTHCWLAKRSSVYIERPFQKRLHYLPFNRLLLLLLTLFFKYNKASTSSMGKKNVITYQVKPFFFFCENSNTKLNFWQAKEEKERSKLVE